jgi:hypothetical protein
MRATMGVAQERTTRCTRRAESLREWVRLAAALGEVGRGTRVRGTAAHEHVLALFRSVRHGEIELNGSPRQRSR